MADQTTVFKIKAIVEGGKEVEKLKRSAMRLSNQAKQSGTAINTLYKATDKLRRSSDLTENQLRDVITTFRDLRSNVALTSNAYKQLSVDIKAAEKRLAFFQGTSKKGRGFAAGAKAAAPAAIGGATASFLPASAQFGASAGFLKTGTLAGGLAGGAIGLGVAATVGLAQQAGEAAKYAAQIKRLEIALRGVTKNSLDFAKAQEVIQVVSKELNIPIDIATKQFTTLSASVIGAGGSVEEAELVFRGVSEAIKATGGEAHDVQSAIRAMSQIFGKGKVSAEELQGQLGERLPGAVVKFADATGRTLPQLQKDLRDGTVGLNDVMKFVVKLSEDHRTAALKMAGGTEEAGQRMDVALKDLKRNFGELFDEIGAGFQNIVTGFANTINAAVSTGSILRQLQDSGEFSFTAQQDIVNQAHKEAAEIFKTSTGRTYTQIFDKLLKDKLKALLESLKESKVTPQDLLGTREEWNVTTNNVADQLKKAKESWKNYVTEIKNINEQVKNAFVNAFKGMEDALVNFITKGKLDFRSLAQSIIADITRIFIRKKIMAPLMDFIGFDKWFAKGGVVGKNGIVPFAKGGVVDSPHIFPFKNGIGVMGEAGAESIMPLKRGRDGKLGVIAHGGASNIVVNVDASGSSVEGDGNGGEELGQILAAAIQSELIDQKRPGGILA